MKLWLVAVLILGGVLAALGVHLYWKDTMGVRTMAARFFPANHEKQDLSGKMFINAWLPHANFRGANLREAEFSNADARHADFSGADFKDAGVSGANFSHARFEGARFNVARGQETAVYRNASFRNTDLSWLSFHGMGGTQNRSKRRHMMDPGYGGADLRNADFTNADLRGAKMDGANTAGAIFTGARMK